MKDIDKKYFEFFLAVSFIMVANFVLKAILNYLKKKA